MYTFIFGGHETEKDAELLIQKIKETDIDILYHEGFGEVEGISDIFQKILDKRRKVPPERIWHQLFDYLILTPFNKTFYPKILFDEELSKIDIILQKRPHDQTWEVREQANEIMEQYKEGIITKLDATKKLIPVYEDLISSEVERETNLIDDLIKLNKEFQNKKIGIFMGIAHSLSVQYNCKLNDLDIEAIELKNRNYINETFGNLKIDYIKSLDLSKEKIMLLIDNFFDRC